MHAPDSTLRCNMVRTNNQIPGNILSMSTRHSHLGNHAEFVETTQTCTVTAPLGDQPGATRSSLPGDVHPKWKVHSATVILFPVSYEEWTMGTIKCNDHGQIKVPKHPHSKCLDSLTTLAPHEWAIWQGQCTPLWTYTTHDVWTWPQASANDHGPIKAPKHPLRNA